MRQIVRSVVAIVAMTVVVQAVRPVVAFQTDGGTDLGRLEAALNGGARRHQGRQ